MNPTCCVIRPNELVLNVVVAPPNFGVLVRFKSSNRTTATTILSFVKRNIAPGTTIYTDGLKPFTGLDAAGYHHVPRTQPARGDLRKGAQSVVPLADRAIGNLQQWLIGTSHGVGRHHLQLYLDEFVFRHNRRQTPMAAFQTLLGLGTGRGPITANVIRGAHDLPRFPIPS